MKKIMDKLLNVDKKILIFLIIICVIGIITGSIFLTILNSSDKNSILVSLEEFITGYDTLNPEKDLINNLIINIMYMLAIWILGISIIGLPIVIFIIFFKAFLLSFTISSFIMKYKLKGILLGIIYNMPHQIINLVVYMYLGVYSIKLSSCIIEAIVHKKSVNFKSITNRYLLVLGISVITLLITTLYETYIMPILLKKLVNMI